MPDLQSPSGPASTPDSNTGGAEALSHLYHMSTTAGVGTQDYVAINPTSIAALLLGFGSAVVVLGNILLLVPAVGIICAIVALLQISRSNQTQTGRGLAIVGLLLCVAFGGGRVGFVEYQRMRAGEEEKQISQLLERLGQELNAGHYEQAYALFDDRFQARVDQRAFTAEFQKFITVGVGQVTSIEWNHQHMEFEQNPDSGSTYADAMAIFRFASGGTPTRLVVAFTKSEGKWKINSIPNLFPPKKGTRQS